MPLKGSETQNSDTRDSFRVRDFIWLIVAIAILGLCARYSDEGRRIRACLQERKEKIAQGIPVGAEDTECPPPRERYLGER